MFYVRNQSDLEKHDMGKSLYMAQKSWAGLVAFLSCGFFHPGWKKITYFCDPGPDQQESWNLMGKQAWQCTALAVFYPYTAQFYTEKLGILHLVAG